MAGIRKLPVLGEWCDPYVVRALRLQAFDGDKPDGPTWLDVLACAEDGVGLIRLYRVGLQTREQAEAARDMVGAFIEERTPDWDGAGDSDPDPEGAEEDERGVRH